MDALMVRLLPPRRALVVISLFASEAQLDDCEMEMFEFEPRACELFTAGAAIVCAKALWWDRGYKVYVDDVVFDNGWYLFPMEQG